MTAMTEQVTPSSGMDRAGRVVEWLVVGGFTCLFVTFLVQALAQFVSDGALPFFALFLTSQFAPLALLSTIIAGIRWFVLFIIKKAS